ncbi:MAG: GGDEF domain-containing protein [Pseudomonadota bacterium]
MPKAREMQSEELNPTLDQHAIMDTLRREHSRSLRQNSPLSLVVAKLDAYPQICRSYGRVAGNRAVDEFAQRLMSIVRPYDAIGRYGPEETILALPGCTLNAAMNVARRINAIVSETPISIVHGRFSTTLSMGLAAVDGDEEWRIDSLIGGARNALKRAVDSGGNRIEFEER